jgi:two-component system LytT family response regulator
MVYKKVIIIDDERLARNELKKLLSEFPEIEVIDEAANADEGIKKIKTLEPDVIFLDIQMPGKTGFDMLKELEHTPQIIFTTAYDEFAIRAFEVNALDYLLKPVEPRRLADVIHKLFENHHEETVLPEGNYNKSILGENDQVFVKDGLKVWVTMPKCILAPISL